MKGFHDGPGGIDPTSPRILLLVLLMCLPAFGGLHDVPDTMTHVQQSQVYECVLECVSRIIEDADPIESDSITDDGDPFETCMKLVESQPAMCGVLWID